MRRKRNKNKHFFELSAQEWGGLICGRRRRRRVVVESDRFDVQKLFQCRLAGASAG